MSADETLARILVAIALTLAARHVLAAGLSRLRQPTVLAEILAGVVLGPTLLGMIPGATDALFPEPVRAALAAIGGLGLVLFMFVVGLELDLRVVRAERHAVAAVSIGALAVPFGLGLVLAQVLHRSYGVAAGITVDRLPFSLFVATALSVTAFPVLARIVHDRGFERSRAAQVAIASAAVQDVAGWILLAVALATVSAGGQEDLVRLALETAALAVALATIVRPLLRRRASTAVVLGGLAACAGATQAMGLHAALGALVFGALVARSDQPERTRELRQLVAPLTTTILLPIFFLGPGLHIDFRAIDRGALGALALILGCACAGKLLGAALPARASGLGWSDSRQVAVLLNTRGLIALIVLEIGRTHGIIDGSLLSLFAVMALTTTLLTGPLLGAASPPARLIAASHFQRARAMQES